VNQATVFIDGGYLRKVLERYGRPRIDHERFADWPCEPYARFRAYYYDCLPFQSSPPTPDERRRLSEHQRFLRALQRRPRFMVRLGRLARRDRGDRVDYVQKGIDLQMGLDIADIANLRPVEAIILVSGDADLPPAVHYAKQRGLLVCLVHGPNGTYHQELWDEADERKEITATVLISVKQERATPAE